MHLEETVVNFIFYQQLCEGSLQKVVLSVARCFD